MSPTRRSTSSIRGDVALETTIRRPPSVVTFLHGAVGVVLAAPHPRRRLPLLPSLLPLVPQRLRLEREYEAAAMDNEVECAACEAAMGCRVSFFPFKRARRAEAARAPQ